VPNKDAPLHQRFSMSYRGGLVGHSENYSQRIQYLTITSTARGLRRALQAPAVGNGVDQKF